MTISSILPSVPVEGISVAIDTSVLAKSLDTTEVLGQNMIKMMEQSVNPSIGSNYDYSI